MLKPGKGERLVKTELILYRNTHKLDRIARPDSFKLNKISYEKRLENLLVFLSDEDMACGSMADLPTDADVPKTLKNSTKVEDLERVKTSNYMLW